MHAWASFVILNVSGPLWIAFMPLSMQAAGCAATVLKLAKSGGVVKRESDERRKARAARMHAYFYGSPQAGLNPHGYSAKADSLSVWRIGVCGGRVSF